MPVQPIVFPVVQPGPSPQAPIRAVLQICRRLVFQLRRSSDGHCDETPTEKLYRALRREDVAVLGCLRLGDVGTLIEVIVLDKDGVVDLSFSPTKEFYFGRPGSGFFVRPAQFVTDGTDGRLVYALAAGDLDEVGVWRLQARVVLPTFPGDFRTEIGEFCVEPNIDTPPC